MDFADIIDLDRLGFNIKVLLFLVFLISFSLASLFVIPLGSIFTYLFFFLKITYKLDKEISNNISCSFNNIFYFVCGYAQCSISLLLFFLSSECVYVSFK